MTPPRTVGIPLVAFTPCFKRRFFMRFSPSTRLKWWDSFALTLSIWRSTMTILEATAMQDAEELVRKCIGCQEFANKLHAPASALKTIPLAWPFAQWGLDMVGPLK